MDRKTSECVKNIEDTQNDMKYCEKHGYEIEVDENGFYTLKTHGIHGKTLKGCGITLKNAINALEWHLGIISMQYMMKKHKNA